MRPFEDVTLPTMINTEGMFTMKAIKKRLQRPTRVRGSAVSVVMLVALRARGHQVQLWRLNAFRIHIGAC